MIWRMWVLVGVVRVMADGVKIDDRLMRLQFRVKKYKRGLFVLPRPVACSYVLTSWIFQLFLWHVIGLKSTPVHSHKLRTRQTPLFGLAPPHTRPLSIERLPLRMLY